MPLGSMPGEWEPEAGAPEAGAQDSSAPTAAALPTRVEIIPTAGIVDAVLTQLSVSTTVTVTCLPHHGLERTMAAALELADHGYNVVPHLAARSVESRQQLAAMVRSCVAGGITEIFAVGGDKQSAAGPYGSSASVMKDLAELSGGLLSMGVGGYPEGHPAITDAQLLDDLRAKAALADYLVTQMCFSPDVIAAYLATLREAGIDLPVWVGVAGAVPRTKLISLATKIGVGSSLRFISGKGCLGLRLLGGSRYSPDALVAGMAALPAPPAGIHFYSFNSLDSLVPTSA